MTDTQNTDLVSCGNASSVQTKEAVSDINRTVSASPPAFSRGFDYGFSDIAYCDDD